MLRPARPVRKSIRIPGYDYSAHGPYFFTICTSGRECLFGRILDGRMVLNSIGRIVRSAWEALPSRSPWIDADAFVTMPNHVHGILHIGGEEMPAGAELLPRPSLPTVVAWFKKATTSEVNQSLGTRGRRLWQRGYYEHIIRNDRALQAIRAYIDANPLEWPRDNLNPERPGGRSPPLRVRS